MLKPLGNYVLVKPEEVSNTTKSGLALPDSAVDRPNQGNVVATGDGLLSDTGEPIPMRVAVYQKVLFPKYSGVELKFDGIKYLLLRESDLFGILE